MNSVGYKISMLMLRILGVWASCPQIGKTVPERRIGFNSIAFFESRNRETARNPRIFRITDNEDSFGFHGKIYPAARILASTVILFFFSRPSFSFCGFVIQKTRVRDSFTFP